MNIDFHYGVIYAVARLGGLGVEEARIVAHACQYVDDAVNGGLLKFAGGETFERIASAHDMIDYKNTEDNQNRRIWVPFHFLPGAEGESFDERALCRPDSAVAREMVRHALRARAADNGLHRLGVTLHVYVDTWAHQGFCGVDSDYNRVRHLEGDDHDYETWFGKLKRHLVETGLDVASITIDMVSGVGHGAALHFPDMPWAKWRYWCKATDAVIERENLPAFIEAADMAYRAVQAFKADTLAFEAQPALPADVKAALTTLLGDSRSHDPDERMTLFGDAIAAGRIPGLKEVLPPYIPKGPGSWKHLATGITARDDGHVAPVWSQQFESSDYRKFHDATKEHRFIVIQEILPTFGLRLC